MQGGRPADVETRSHFGEPFAHPEFRQKRALCKHCQKECTGTAAKMKQHLASCQTYVDLSVEARLVSEASQDGDASTEPSDKKRKFSQTRIGRVHVDSISKEDQCKADMLLEWHLRKANARAIGIQ